jgi:hypothetical protein
VKEVGMKRRFGLALPLAGAMVLLVAGSGSAGVLVNVAVPFSAVVSVPCANGGVGEDVALEGFLHVLITETVDRNDVGHTTSHFQPLGISGTGLTTGDSYEATGITRDQVNGTEPPFEVTFVNNFRIIGQSTGNNLLIHEIFHVTVSANGELTVFVDNLSAECK